jgi:hypothetical protein
MKKLLLGKAQKDHPERLPGMATIGQQIYTNRKPSMLDIYKLSGRK